jgi:HD superfamily phosphodiesterase
MTHPHSTFDELAISPAEREALSRLRTATGEIGGPMERHCLRCRHIAAELASRRGWIVDGEVLTVAAILHDVGLYPGVATGDAYVADGAALARAVLERHGWSPTRIELCAEAIDRRHELRRQQQRGVEIEALRQADLVDVSGGLLRFGLDREWLRSLRRVVPARGLAGELFREVGRALRERPLTLPRIFLRG